jgi:RNA polymerase sigma-70 factor (ECF subfamily)
LRVGDDSDATFADLVAPSPAREAATGEFSALVATCMEKLDARHREILTLRNLLNRSYDEIAQALGINVGTVKSRIARARGNLRALLAEACPEFSPDAAPSDWFEPTRATGRLEVAAA